LQPERLHRDTETEQKNMNPKYCRHDCHPMPGQAQEDRVRWPLKESQNNHNARSECGIAVVEMAQDRADQKPEREKYYGKNGIVLIAVCLQGRDNYKNWG
jgi:hypothetical protein